MYELNTSSSPNITKMIVTDLIGDTPLVEIQNINPNKGVTIYAKLEGQNPGGSVKDRAAYGMIKGALDRKEIKPGDRLVEATSGNTGIALAMIARVMGLHITLLMPENSTIERVKTMKGYGAEVNKIYFIRRYILSKRGL